MKEGNIPIYKLEDLFKAYQKPCIAFNMVKIGLEPLFDEDKPHRNDYYQIIVLEKGTMNLTIEFDTYKASAPCVSVIFPKQFHQVEFPAEARGEIIMFGDELFCSAVLKKDLSAYNVNLQRRLNYIPSSTEDFTMLRDVTTNIRTLYEQITLAKKEQIKFYIKILLLKLIEYGHSKEPSRAETEDADIYLHFRDLVEEQFKECRLVQRYAEKLNITPKRLNAICNQYAGETALNVIHERILLEIKRLLVFFDYSHKEIAYDLGFDSPSALNKFIAAKLNCTPSELKFRLSHIYKD